jgi:dihydrofolate reductase
MVSSLDGFIAKSDNDMSWFETVDHYEKGITLSEQEVTDFLQKIDCYVMGARTYELALTAGWPYGDTPVIVLTHKAQVPARPTVKFYQGDIRKLVTETLQPKYQNVWMVGGAMLAKAFIEQQLADEIRLSVMPIILGEGKPFFDQIQQEHTLHLLDVKAYKNGIVELHYQIKE